MTSSASDHQNKLSEDVDSMTPVDELLDILDLEVLEHNLFRGRSPKTGWQRVFGGQVIGQALVAAQRTVDADRHVHSLHGYFLRPGDPSIPIIYEVDRIRDGGSFTTRRVIGIQHGKAIFSTSVSFQKFEDGLDYQMDMPDIKGPEGLLTDKQLKEPFLADAPEQLRRYWNRPRPVEIRPVEPEHYTTNNKLPPIQNVWVRTTGPVPDDQALHAAVLAYASDMTLLDTALFPHGKKVSDRDLQTASLDHAMWFHRPVNVNDWLLFTQDTPNSNGGRGLTRGTLYDKQGALIASCVQEGLIRPRDPSRRPQSGMPKKSS